MYCITTITTFSSFFFYLRVLYMPINVILVVEFQKWWVLESKIFGQSRACSNHSFLVKYWHHFIFYNHAEFFTFIVITKYNGFLWIHMLINPLFWNSTTDMTLMPLGLLTFFVYFKAWKYFKDSTNIRNLNIFFFNENVKCLTCNYAQRTQPKVRSSWTFFWYSFWTFRFPLLLLRVVLEHIGGGQLARSTNDCHLMVLLVKPNKHDLLLKQPGAFQLQGTTDL